MRSITQTSATTALVMLLSGSCGVVQDDEFDRVVATQAEECPEAPAPGSRVGLSNPLSTSPGQVFRTVMAVLEELQYEIMEADSLKGHVTTAPQFQWTDLTENEPWHGGQHPGVMVHVKWFADGSVTALTTEAKAVCAVEAPGVDQAELANGVAIAAALRISNRIRQN